MAASPTPEAAASSSCKVKSIDAEVYRTSHVSLPCPIFVDSLAKSGWQCSVQGSNRWDFAVSLSAKSLGGRALAATVLPHSRAEAGEGDTLILSDFVLTGFSSLDKYKLHDFPANAEEGGQLFVRSCAFVFERGDKPFIELLGKVFKELTLLNKCCFVASHVSLTRVIHECKHEIRADIADAQHQAAVRLQLSENPPNLLRFASAPDSFLDLRLQCASAILAGRIVPTEKCIHVMGFTRWVQRFVGFQANTGSLIYSDTADGVEALRRSHSAGHHLVNKHVLQLDHINEHRHLSGTGWVVSHFILKIQSRDIELKKEANTSGIWLDALYSLISAWHGMKASRVSFGDSRDAQVANYSAWLTAALEQRLQSRVKEIHDALVCRKQVVVVDGGSMKFVSFPVGQPQQMKVFANDRKQVAGGVYFTSASTCHIHPVWGIIISNVYSTSNNDMFNYGHPQSLALTPLSSSFSPQAVEKALMSAIRLRSKPCSDIKVKGQVALFVFSSQLQRADSKSSTCTLILEGCYLTAHDTTSRLEHSIYLSHCTGILPVFVRRTRQGNLFKPKLDASDERRPNDEQCYFKIANCKVITKSLLSSNMADVIVQTSGREARDQWIRNLYLAKKASVTSPPLLPLSLPKEALFSDAHVDSGLKLNEAAPSPKNVTSHAVAKNIQGSPALCVILPISNPIGFRRREQLFQETLARMLSESKCNQLLHVISIRLDYKLNPVVGVRCLNVEKQHQQRYSDLHVETTLDDILWSKENLINLSIKWIKGSDFGLNVEAIAWVDADIEFISKDWVESTLDTARRLQANGGGFLQMFEQAELLGPDNKPMYNINGFAHQYCLGLEYADRVNTDLRYWHPGFAWAAPVHTLDMLAEFYGGVPLIERTLGGGDRHMAMGIIGKGEGTVPQALSDDYRLSILRWCDAAQRLSLGMAFVRGIIRHSWHGSFEDRKYVQRWDVLSKHNFKPSIHMVTRQDGLVTWAINAPEDLKRMTMQYFLERNEDSLQRKRGDGLFETIGGDFKFKPKSSKNSHKQRKEVGVGGDDALTEVGFMDSLVDEDCAFDDGSNSCGSESDCGHHSPTQECHDHHHQHVHEQFHDGEASEPAFVDAFAFAGYA